MDVNNPIHWRYSGQTLTCNPYLFPENLVPMAARNYDDSLVVSSYCI